MRQGRGRYTLYAVKICFRCNAVNVVKLSDHKPECPLLRDKSDRAKSIKDLVNRFHHKNKAKSGSGLSRIDKPGYCKRCGEKAGNLLTHLRTCKPKPQE